MKCHLIAAMLPLAALTATAQNESISSRALLIEESGAFQQVWITRSSRTQVEYKSTEVSTALKTAKISDLTSVFIFEPLALTEAMDLYQGRKYSEAKAKFAEVKKTYNPIASLRDNPSSIAGYYEMECMRKLNDLEGLSAAMKDFNKNPLSRDFQLRQLELYIIWDAVRTQSWDRVDILVNQRSKSRLPPSQRAQLAYLHGLALEALERKSEALNAFSMAMTADGGSSDVIARQAALRILAIHSADQGVQTAIERAGTDQENKRTQGYADVLEAASVATIYQTMLADGNPLPDEYKVFLKFQPKANEQPAAEAKKAPEKKAAAKAKPAAKKK